ncbi:MAG: hypothetical protein ACREKF_06005 [Candidatus Methylomirabilales bacterium]
MPESPPPPTPEALRQRGVRALDDEAEGLGGEAVGYGNFEVMHVIDKLLRDLIGSSPVF